jgi:biotin carboxyl carrier protein
VKYFVQENGEVREVTVEAGEVLVDGRRLPADLRSLPGSERRHLRVDGRSVSLYARRTADGWSVELEGRVFEIRVEDERRHRIRELAAAAAPREARRELRAPMPGLVVRVDVKEGQEVGAGESLVVMEAMKMENELRSESPGRVARVAVEAGRTVNRDDLLVVLEPSGHE